MRQRGAIERIVFKNFEFISIEAIQSILRADPYIPEAVLKNTIGLWLRETVFDGIVIKSKGWSLCMYLLCEQQKQDDTVGQVFSHRNMQYPNNENTIQKPLNESSENRIYLCEIIASEKIDMHEQRI